MSVKVKTDNIKNFVAIDENIYEALELMGVEMDLLGFKILNDNEEFKAWDYKVIKRKEQDHE